MEIGNKIKQLRFKHSLTQEQLAQQLGISAQAISKWENSVSMPDITLLPDIAKIFGISIDELFDITIEQKFCRIENLMDLENDIDAEVFHEYENFLKEQIRNQENKQRALELLAHLYNHRMESYSRLADKYARESIMLAPEKKACQWILTKAEGSDVWDWNISNHSKTIDFYKSVIEHDEKETKTPLPYYYLIDNLIADHRTKEALHYLKIISKLPAHHEFMVPIYEAAIALAEFDEKRADSIIENAMQRFSGDPGFLFEVAQYYAKKCEYDKAIEFYEASYSLEENKKPRYTDALNGISAIYEICGEYHKALETQKRILELLKNEWGFTDEVVIHDVEQEIERINAKIQSNN